jgi:hypothetical protein
MHDSCQAIISYAIKKKFKCNDKSFVKKYCVRLSTSTPLPSVFGITVHRKLYRAGRAIAQTVSRWLPTAAAWIQTRVWLCGDFVMDKSGAGAGFLQELRFPLPIYIPSASAQSSSLSPEAGT